MKIKMQHFVNPYAIADLKWTEILRLGLRRLKILMVMPLLLIVFNLFVVVSSLENKVIMPLFLTLAKVQLDKTASFILLWARRM